MRNPALAVALSVAAFACDGGGEPAAPEDAARAPGLVDAEPPDAALPDARVPPRLPLDDVLRLNHLQARGTHNSYHLLPEVVRHESHRYAHASLTLQLAEQGVRQFELDVHYRTGEGFEVFHLPLVDEETTCRRLADCLAEVKAWSDHHPGHVPILFWLEPKDDLDVASLGLEPMDGHFDELDALLRSVFPASRMFEPDELRGDAATLPAAIAARGWPTLGELRGQVVFALLDGGAHGEAYRAEAPALQGRAMFAHPDSPDDPWAAMFKVNNAQSDGDRVRALVEAGFIVTSNADGVEADGDANTAKRDATLAAGAHFLSTDYPAPGGGDDYWLEIPGAGAVRCNPISAPPSCDDAALEP